MLFNPEITRGKSFTSTDAIGSATIGWSYKTLFGESLSFSIAALSDYVTKALNVDQTPPSYIKRINFIRLETFC